MTRSTRSWPGQQQAWQAAMRRRAPVAQLVALGLTAYIVRSITVR
jgi:hypothetical protein